MATIISVRLDDHDKIPCYVVECPHCQGLILIKQSEINCGVFRHAVHQNGLQVNAHASYQVCKEALDNKGMGCGGAFKFNGQDEPTACDHST